MTYTWPADMSVKTLLGWPGEPTPADRRQRSPFKAAWSTTVTDLRRELDQVNAKVRVLQIAIPERRFRLDGFPYADATPEHPGVIVTFTTKRLGDLSYPCDTFTSWQDNIRAIALALEALRKVDRYGVTSHGQQYAGFKAIGPGPVGAMAMSGSKAKAMDAGDARALLNVLADGWDDAAYRRARRKTHPDRGGDAATFNEVMRAGRALGFER